MFECEKLLSFVISILSWYKEKRKKSTGVNLSWGDAPGGLDWDVGKSSPKKQTYTQV